MYWPKASVKKQLELEIIKATMVHKSIRKSVDISPSKDPNNEDNTLDESSPNVKKVGQYDKPWRINLAKTPIN